MFVIYPLTFPFLSTTSTSASLQTILLKNSWGRERPNDILELGGDGIFTPWFVFSDFCEKNCSFVSGDASVGFSIIVFYFLTNKKIFIWLSLFSGWLLGIIRILEGGHFLSDVLFAGFFIFFLSYLQYIIYKKKFKNEY